VAHWPALTACDDSQIAHTIAPQIAERPRQC
jgi:hypothetical protein